MNTPKEKIEEITSLFRSGRRAEAESLFLEAIEEYWNPMINSRYPGEVLEKAGKLRRGHVNIFQRGGGL